MTKVSHFATKELTFGGFHVVLLQPLKQIVSSTLGMACASFTVR